MVYEIAVLRLSKLLAFQNWYKQWKVGALSPDIYYTQIDRNNFYTYYIVLSRESAMANQTYCNKIIPLPDSR